LRAAKYMGVPPWELLKQPIYWRNWALQAEKAENEAERQRQEAEKRRNKAKGR